MQAGWFGTVADFLAISRSTWLADLQRHYVVVTQENASASQVDAWRDCFTVLQDQLNRLISDRPDSRIWACIFEYELPREGGRRPDLVILAADQVIVIEFKEKVAPAQADVDQVFAYAKDLAHYHEQSHHRTVSPVLVPTKAEGPSGYAEEVLVVPPLQLAKELSRLIPSHTATAIDPPAWLNAEYAPLPSLVQAARHVFEHERLPYIKRAHAAGIDETIAYLVSVAERSRQQGERHLALITGVPGAGKTLVGLRFVYEHHFGDQRSAVKAVFLSGNGPLVEVLRHALKSSVFVQPMRNFIKQYGISKGYPKEQVLVFDEAQRAWSIDHVQKKHGHSASEPDMLIGVAERLPGWSMLLGLIGEGQEIHLGEEAGLVQWNTAIAAGKLHWHVHSPPEISHYFTAAHQVSKNPSLSLNSSLRTHLARDVQEWVRYLLMGEVDFASRFAPRMRLEGFHMYVTRSLEHAKQYVRERYQAHPLKRYGLLASSKGTLLPSYGVHQDWQTTKRLRVGQWYNDPPNSPQSCCQLDAVATEFACQGLELDLPIVCWNNDLWWETGAWRTRKPYRTEAKDPHQLRVNSYRVLLSRGRDGFIVFVPPEKSLDGTYETLLQAGAQALPMAAIRYGT